MEGLHKSKLQDSVQVPTALDDQETIRKRKLHVWNNVVERASVTESQKTERKHALKGKWENAFSGKQRGQCSKGDSCSISHDPASVAASWNGCEAHKAKGPSSSSAVFETMDNRAGQGDGVRRARKNPEFSAKTRTLLARMPLHFGVMLGLAVTVVPSRRGRHQTK